MALKLINRTFYHLSENKTKRSYTLMELDHRDESVSAKGN